jgi:hypothetical protein
MQGAILTPRAVQIDTLRDFLDSAPQLAVSSITGVL